MGDSNLGTDIDRMIRILQSTSDNTICNMQENNDKKMTTLFVLYEYLSHVAHWRQPWLLGSLSLRMVELTIKNGLNAMSPLSFAYFGGVLSSLGYVNEGCRLGESINWMLVHSLTFRFVCSLLTIYVVTLTLR